ncbi:MAG: LuxR C-terminal-related transcriptional regulator [Kineosporiaceae bacterium]
MPPDEPGAMPALVRAARAMVRFDLDACREHLAFADKLADQESLDDRAPLLASVAVVRAVLARAEGDILTAEAALAEGEAQLALVPELAEGHPEMAALLLSNVGTVQLWAGRTDEAERTLRRALAASTGPGCEYPRLNVLGRLAMAEFRRGRLRRAARLGQEELAFAEDSGLPVAYRTGAGQLVLAMVALEWNDRPAVRRHLDDTEKTVGARRDPFVATAVPLLRAWQHAEAGDHRRAVAAVAHVPSTFAGRPLPAWLATRISMAAAALHLKRGETGAASAALEAAPERGPEWAVARAGLALATGDRATAEQLLAPFLAGDVPQIEATTIQAWLLAAMLRQRDGDPAAAREALERALTLARPEGHRRVFLEARAWVGQMLRAHPDLAAAHGWLGAPLVAAGAAQPQPGRAIEEPPRALIEPLTERETTVLARMAQAMSTDDIAQDLFVSLNTVKTHQRSIYRKLAVSRKNEAVRKARQLGLV